MNVLLGRACALLALAGILFAFPARSDDARPEEWPGYGRDSGEQRFSPLKSISTENVKNLGVAWSYDMRVGRGVEATPLVVNGVMYVTSAWSMVYALDAKTGREIWVFDPEVDRAVGAKSCCDAVNRGVAYADGRVFVAALDGRLIAIDAKTGKSLWQTQTFDTDVEARVITGAPRVAKGLVFIGNSGADIGLGLRGYMGAYDAKTGKLAWRFYTVPGDPSKGGDGVASDSVMPKAAQTWTGEWWKHGGGGTVWDSIIYDEELDRVYIGVGNGQPWNHQVRSPDGGDNLFLSSIVALDRKTGKYIWHYQTTPGDSWDLTATQHIMLARLKINGKMRRVLMQAPKNGFFYVIDRDTGKLVSAGKLVPMAKAYETPPGQPISWAYDIDMKTGRPLENPEARFKNGTTAFVHPVLAGAHNWHPMAYSPDTGLVYIPMQDPAAPFKNDPNFKPSRRALSSGMILPGSFPQDAKMRESFSQMIPVWLVAWDPVRQKEAWRFPGEYVGNGGVLATAGGLVFHSKTRGDFVAHDAKTGKALWSFDGEAVALGGPMSYAIDGEQYIAIAVGNGGGPFLPGGMLTPGRAPLPLGRVIVFKLNGNAPFKRTKDEPLEIPPPPKLDASLGTINAGDLLYHDHCGRCHGSSAISGRVIPDLRASPIIQSRELFQDVVIGGVLQNKGMPIFDKELRSEDLDKIRAYIAAEAEFARTGKAVIPPPPPPPPPSGKSTP